MSRNHRRFSSPSCWFVVSLFLLGSALLWSRAALAHGGGRPRLTGEEAGPYRLFVWTNPDPLLAGEAHISIAVVKAAQSDGHGESAGELDTPVTDAVVQVQFVPIGQTAPVMMIEATRSTLLNSVYYEADVLLPQAGLWRITVSAHGVDGRGEATFEATVQSAPERNWALIGGASVALVILIALMIGWSRGQGKPPRDKIRGAARTRRGKSEQHDSLKPTL